MTDRGVRLPESGTQTPRSTGRAGRVAVAAVSWLIGAGAAVATLLAPWRWPHLAVLGLCALFVAVNGWAVPRRADRGIRGQAVTLAAFFGGLGLLAWLVPLLR